MSGLAKLSTLCSAVDHAHPGSGWPCQAEYTVQNVDHTYPGRKDTHVNQKTLNCEELFPTLSNNRRLFSAKKEVKVVTDWHSLAEDKITDKYSELNDSNFLI